jgi:hypothetical protein
MSTEVLRFSSTMPDAAAPVGWHPWVLSRFSKRTDYRIVQVEHGNVLQATAHSSSSGLLYDVNIDPAERPILTWSWKATALMPEADTSHLATDDSPTRVIVAFDGDRSKFDVEERAMASMVKLIGGRDMPYATLMYVWDPKLPVETVFEHPRSSRLRAIVVESGPARVGQWIAFRRDVAADFRRAFGEEPQRIESVGVMTDSNQTGSNVTSYYGDIVFHTPSSLAAASAGAETTR